MSHFVSANKYRPKDFDELIGQEFIASSLKNSFNKNRVANAYLLSGPRGVGKTSTARIIAKALNCIQGPTGTPCNSCENCISITQGFNPDVIEIDGASNTSINDVKIIQEEILYPPVKSKYKVYIIDEVHMLSKSAFNALLKTIEEPPEYVVFIFATTEINKVIPTIRSRCQQFNFRLIPTEQIYFALEKVLKEANIKYEENALMWIANEGKGSMRDAYTILDQIISFCDNEITMEKIRDKMGIIDESKIYNLVLGIIEHDRQKVFLEYLSVIEAGISFEQLIIELIQFFRNILFIKSNLSITKLRGITYKSIDNKVVNAFNFEDIENIIDLLYKCYESIRFSLNPQIEFESYLIKVLNYKNLIRPGFIIDELKKIKSYLEHKKIDQINTDVKSEIAIDNKNEKTDHNFKKVEQSEILKIIKNKIANVNAQLLLALNNISFIEETNNQLKLFFSHKMYYDIAKANETYLTKEAVKIIGENYNKDFKIIVLFQENKNENIEKNKTKEAVIKIFHGKEI